MSFVSVQFIIFFFFVTALYFVLPHKFRWFLLLISSVIFYMAFIPQYILILLALIIIDYTAGRLIASSKGHKRRVYLIISILSTCLTLFVFKYFNFFIDNYVDVVRLFHAKSTVRHLDIILPLGLSFHTFQSLAYVIEVYRKKQKPEKNFGIYALYVMFYPQLVAGPIERPQNLLHQFYEKHHFEYERIVSGLRLMLWGVFMKIVIADRLAMIVNYVYKDPTKFEGLPLIVATIAFAFQIFCDFAGYSNIAIGAARVMGFNLMKNFNNPYISRSVQEFWTRWHISLCTWFRDYVYIPLGGNRVGIPRWAINIMIVFLLSGLWHGANWTFVIWGGLNGVYMIIHRFLGKYFYALADLFFLPKQQTLFKVVQTVTTFSLVTFSWIFFRAQNLSDALYISTHLFNHLGRDLGGLVNINVNMLLTGIAQKTTVLGIPAFDLIMVVLAIIGMETILIKQESVGLKKIFSSKPIFLRWAAYYILIFLIAYYVTTRQEQFIYFQF